MFEKTKINEKEAGVGPFEKTNKNRYLAAVGRDSRGATTKSWIQDKIFELNKWHRIVSKNLPKKSFWTRYNQFEHLFLVQPKFGAKTSLKYTNIHSLRGRGGAADGDGELPAIQMLKITPSVK